MIKKLFLLADYMFCTIGVVTLRTVINQAISEGATTLVDSLGFQHERTILERELLDIFPENLVTGEGLKLFAEALSETVNRRAFEELLLLIWKESAS